MVEVPGVRPVTTPVPETVHTTVLVLAQATKGVVVLSVMVLPAHTVVGPVIGAGMAATLTTVVVIQPPEEVYVMVAVPGAGVADTPVIRPLPLTMEAIALLLLLHVPPGVAELRVVEIPWQTVVMPVMFAGMGNTVKVLMVIHPAAVV